jgi:hypothetical protein
MTHETDHFEYRIGLGQLGRGYLPWTTVEASEAQARADFERIKLDAVRGLRPGDSVILVRRPLGPWQTVDEWTVPGATEGGGG